MLNLRPRLLCETGGETSGSESLGLSMERPKRTVSSLNAQTLRLAGLGLTVQLSSPTCHVPMHEGEQSASYSASSLRTIRWFPELPAGEHSIFLRYNTGCRQKLCPPPAFLPRARLVPRPLLFSGLVAISFAKSCATYLSSHISE